MSAARRGVALLAAALATGCGTIMLSPHESFRLESVPDGAHFEVRDGAKPVVLEPLARE